MEVQDLLFGAADFHISNYICYEGASILRLGEGSNKFTPSKVRCFEMSQIYRASDFDYLNRARSLAGCEHGSEPSGSMKGGELLAQQIYFCFLFNDAVIIVGYLYNNEF
jgi:hypothetical protein